MDYIKTKNYRGQPVKVQGNRCLIIIRNAQPQRNTPPTIGLSDALLSDALRYRWTIFVKVENHNVEFSTTAKDWIKGSKKEEQPSYYNIPWYIYRKPIPREAFKFNEKPKKEGEEEHVMQSLNFYG